MAKAESARVRCPWAEADPLMSAYHDTEWGRPNHDDRIHFEFLVLESAQAGLSWSTILKKREAYRKAFCHFDPKKVARLTEAHVQKLLEDSGIVRHRGKIEATISNARAFLDVQREFGSFDAYCWSFVGGRPKVNRWRSMSDVPNETPESKALSKDLRSRGFKFLGSTTAYAFMQAMGLVDDHTSDCFCSKHRKNS